jgi:RNA polymerase sigma-70 factor (ECF subfamily)
MILIDGDSNKRLFNGWYDEYKDYLYRVAFAILHNSSQAEDAVSETFLKAAENFRKIKDEPCPKVKSFFVILCRNISINMYRQNKRETHIDISRLEDTEFDSDIENFDTELIRNALKQLPQIYYDALYFEYFWGYSIEEIAGLTKTSKDTAYKRSQRAKIRLKEILLKDGDFHG